METTERDGLDNMDWTEGHLDCRAGGEEKLKSVAKKVEGDGGENRHGRGGCRNRAERAGESFCYNVFGARDVDNITGELGDKGKKAHLSNGPRRRGTEKG